MDDGPLVTVVVNNYNYARFLRTSIESALGQTYPRTEVVVVDDGSTDESAAIVDSYGARVRSVLKPNGGQGSAFNHGLAVSSGELVLFLDSDDYLFPTAVETIVRAYRPGASKVQCRLTVVDAEGRAVGQHPPPDMPLDEGDVASLLLERGHYATPVGSGNAHSRAALERVFPVPEEEFRYGADGYVNATVPFYGPVVAVDVPLAAYRVHEENYSGMPGVLDVGRFHFTIRHNLATERAIARTARAVGRTAGPDIMLRYPGHVEARLASLRLDPAAHPIRADRRASLAVRGVVASWRYSRASALRRLVDAAWFVAVALLPRRSARALIAWKYVRGSRPRAVRALVRQIRRVIG